jgi:hypothetical protein
VKRAAFEPGREWRTVNAIHRKDLPMAQKSLLIAIAKHESRRDKVCRASIPSLAADMGSDVKTVRFAMHGLGKILRIKNVPGLASRIVIDWKRFAELPGITPTESGRGASRRGPLPKAVGVPLPNPVGVPPPESGTTQRVKNQGSESGAVCVGVEKTSGEMVSHHHPLDDFKKIVLAKCKDPHGILSTAIDIIIERARRSGVNVSTPKYLEAALGRFNFEEGQDREELMQGQRRQRL